MSLIFCFEPNTRTATVPRTKKILLGGGWATPCLTSQRDEAAARSAITVMIDGPDHLDMIEKAAAGTAAASEEGPHPVRVCIDIDAGYVALRGLMRAGARRSPIRTPADAAASVAPPVICPHW